VVTIGSHPDGTVTRAVKPQARTGRARWFAPGRVNLIGDHTDYQDGWVLPFALERGTTVTVEVNDTSRVVLSSDGFGQAPPLEVGDVVADAGWWRYVYGALTLLRSLDVALPGASISIESSLPVGVGVASSASITCATIGALMQAVDIPIDRRHVALLAQRVEHEYAGAEVGFMDPAAVMFGRRAHALLIDTRAQTIDPIAFDLDDAGLALLLVESGNTHMTSGAEYATRVAQCRAAAKALSVTRLRDVRDVSEVNRIADPVLRARARHVVTENDRVEQAAALLRSGRLRDVGRLLLASHESLRDDFAASTASLDLIVESAMVAGALGGRVTGAGFGGCSIVLLDRLSEGAVIASLQDAFTRSGRRRPLIRKVAPAGGARAVVAA
jgi:galactokinase